jgi:hypothetical protein
MHTPAEIAGPLRGTKGNAPAYVAVLLLEDIQRLGITLKPDPIEASGDLPAGPGHCLLSELTYDNRHMDRCQEWMVRLVDACIELYGPFPPGGILIEAPRCSVYRAFD